MGVVPLKEAKAGDVLVQEVTDAQGRLIVRAGAILTAEVIEKLKARNVQHVTVQGGEEAKPKATAEETEARITHMFAPHVGNDLMARLEHAVRAHVAKTREGAAPAAPPEAR